MSKNEINTPTTKEISFDEFQKDVLNDYRIINESREASILGRREVLTGKAQFGIFGDGKELAQVAMAKYFQKGDFRSGYYRDQTLMLASGLTTINEFFAQLYAHADVTADSSSAGRQMNCHYATRSLNDDGSWKDLTAMKNSSSDLAPTGSQMPRLLGLAYASYFYRNNPLLSHMTQFSKKGNEIAFGTIGDASTSEGMFWETINAAGVLQIPMVISIWDDGYGISVPKSYQTTKESISEIMKGFQRTKKIGGYEIFVVKGWDYPALCSTYEKAVNIARTEHVPVLIHVEEMTQPQGHSSSGSHERYKSKERLEWEADLNPIKKMKEWIIASAIAKEEELLIIEDKAKKDVRQMKAEAWNAFIKPIQAEAKKVVTLIEEAAASSPKAEAIHELKNKLASMPEPRYRDVVDTARKVMRILTNENSIGKEELNAWLKEMELINEDRFHSHLHSQSAQAVANVKVVKVEYAPDAAMEDGRIVLRENFDAILNKMPEVMIFGEDSGKIGGVNQGLEGLQTKYSELRVFDTGIREATIVGQGIGLAMRGLRPIAEIQYLDYLLYALQIMSDELATLHYRTKGGQKAPLIIKTRGHRLEGIWHTGSPMGMLIHACRGIYICVPRNMTQAAGFYNTLLQADEPALVIESLNGYRLKEKMPSNFGEFTVPLGIPETLKEGTDITLVTYGSLCRIAMAASEQLQEMGVSVEVIDVQTLIPFDINHTIVESLKKTNRILFVDEDVPGGASSYMMQKVLEEQGGYFHLDAPPKTVTAKEHRTPYGTDGDYFSKPSLEDIVDAVLELVGH